MALGLGLGALALAILFLADALILALLVGDAAGLVALALGGQASLGRDPVLVRLLAVRDVLERLVLDVDRLVLVVPEVEDLVHREREPELVALVHDLGDRVRGLRDRGGLRDQAQLGQHLDQRAVHRDLTLGPRPDQVGAARQAEVLEVADGLARHDRILGEEFEVEAVGLLEDVLEVRLQRRGRRLAIVQEIGALLARTGTQVPRELLDLADASLVPIDVRGTQGLHGLEGLGLGQVAHQHHDGTEVHEGHALRLGLRVGLPRLDLSDQLRNDVRLLGHVRMGRSAQGGWVRGAVSLRGEARSNAAAQERIRARTQVRSRPRTVDVGDAAGGSPPHRGAE